VGEATLSDQRLLIAGDGRADVREADAFTAELVPLLPRATRLAAAMLLDTAAAEDAVQEAAIRAWRKRSNRRPGTDLGPWFLAIVANRCRDVRRAGWARVLRFAEVPALAPADPPGGDTAAVVDVRRALLALPHHDRLVVVLRYYLDLPFAEVAVVAGCSVEAAKSRMRRAEARLRTALGTPEVRR
jgi:RNA polymerase sigma-70 factor, ECF subfamily